MSRFVYSIDKHSIKQGLLVLLLGIVVLFLNNYKSFAHNNNQKVENLEIYDDIGGDFKLISSSNQNVKLKDFRQKVVVMFFGYTTCPDSCPSTLSFLKQIIKRLGKRADQVQPLFITVDPKRDTPEKMKNYLSSFDGNFIGLTGTKEEILDVAENYGSAYMKNPSIESKSNYLMIHTGNLYLIDQSGKVRAIYPEKTEINQIVNDIENLLAS